MLHSSGVNTRFCNSNCRLYISGMATHLFKKAHNIIKPVHCKQRNFRDHLRMFAKGSAWSWYSHLYYRASRNQYLCTVIEHIAIQNSFISCSYCMISWRSWFWLTDAIITVVVLYRCFFLQVRIAFHLAVNYLAIFHYGQLNPGNCRILRSHVPVFRWPLPQAAPNYFCCKQ